MASIGGAGGAAIYVALWAFAYITSSEVGQQAWIGLVVAMVVASLAGVALAVASWLFVDPKGGISRPS